MPRSRRFPRSTSSVISFPRRPRLPRLFGGNLSDETRMKLKIGFVPIRLEEYVELHLRSNPGVERTDLIRRLQHAINAFKRGVRCQCGEPIWIIGSAEAGLGC